MKVKNGLTLLILSLLPLFACSTSPLQAARQSVEAQNAICTKEKENRIDNSVCVSELMSRYATLVSLSLEQYKTYPEEARLHKIEGNAVALIRIDRLGKIQYATIQQKTGSSLLDQVVTTMIDKADPLPALPSNYPAGDLVEFLIPVNFMLNMPK